MKDSESHCKVHLFHYFAYDLPLIPHRLQFQSSVAGDIALPFTNGQTQTDTDTPTIPLSWIRPPANCYSSVYIRVTMKWKWLFVNDCGFKRKIAAQAEQLKYCQDETTAFEHSEMT